VLSFGHKHLVPAFQKLAALVDYASSDAFSDKEKQLLAFAEQFVIDVSGVSDADREMLNQQFEGDLVRGFVMGLYITEFTQRLGVMSNALLGASGNAQGDGSPSATSSHATSPRATSSAEASTDVQELHQALRTYQEAVVRGTDLDAALTELVRLRCARSHACRMCRTLRLADAHAAGVDENMTEKIDFYERSDLGERTKVALRITDAFITVPGAISAEVVAQGRATFSPAELAELLLDITKWSTQKIHVALGTDGAEKLPTNADGVSYFAFDEDGRVSAYSATP